MTEFVNITGNVGMPTFPRGDKDRGVPENFFSTPKFRLTSIDLFVFMDYKGVSQALSVEGERPLDHCDN